MKPPRLSDANLQEYRLRHAVMARIDHERLMVQESYQGWITRTLESMGLKGQFIINLETGEIAPQPQQKHA